MKCTTSGSDVSCVNGTRSSLSSLSTLFSSSISFVHHSISLSNDQPRASMADWGSITASMTCTMPWQVYTSLSTMVALPLAATMVVPS